MTDAESKESRKESPPEHLESWLEHMPKSFQVLWHFAKERGLLDESKRHEGGEK